MVGIWANQGEVRAQAGACSSTSQADEVIHAAPDQSALVDSVAQSVPTDPPNCVPSYCEASSDESEDVRMAVGAGLAEAYAQFLASEDDEQAMLVNVMACASTCDEVVASAYAAGLEQSLDQACIVGDKGSKGEQADFLRIGADGGGKPASGN